MIKKLIFAFGLAIGVLTAHSQEYLIPVSTLQNTIRHPHKTLLKSVSSTLQLPFIDDFSYDSHTPDQTLWTDRGININNNFGINPYSVGVATFDAVDSDGRHYDHASSTPYLSDFLTSNFIDLSKADSTTTYLSFFYQPQGNGNAPEIGDSLVLQITSGDGKWRNIWAAAGTDYATFRSNVLHLVPNRPDTLEFALVILPINQSKYFTDKFQFRFFNYASLAGSFNPSATINCDHWNIDFVYLNDGRSAYDTTFYDIAFVEPSVTMLKNFTSIPWAHYPTAIATENTRINIHLRNHWERNMKAEVRIRIKDLDNNEWLNDSITLGTANYESQYNTKMVYSYDDNPIVFDERESATFMFECELYPDKDELIPGNNKFRTYQHFGNYYSYDDGTAENAYGVDSKFSQVAYLYTPYKSDLLSGLSICFLPSNPTESAASEFYICAWENNEGKPGKQLLCEKVTRPEFSGTNNEFMNFEFSSPLSVNKSIFVGWQQTNELRLNVGWDVNRYSQSKIFYNTTGVWLPTSFSGSLMLRPIFDGFSSQISEPENIETQLTIYPNPAKNNLIINGAEEENISIQILNIAGQIIKTCNKANIDISDLESGLYILQAKTSQRISTLKFIKQ